MMKNGQRNVWVVGQSGGSGKAQQYRGARVMFDGFRAYWETFFNYLYEYAEESPYYSTDDAKEAIHNITHCNAERSSILTQSLNNSCSHDMPLRVIDEVIHLDNNSGLNYTGEKVVIKPGAGIVCNSGTIELRLGDHRPVERVSWFDACLYCNQLSIMENLEPCYYLDPGFTVIFDGTPPINVGPVYWKTDATGYRLPTEAEWEYLCRAGTTTDFNNGEEAGLFCSSDNFGLLAWYFDNSDYATHDVALKEPNNWNLFDMHGNVWEWVWDGWGLYDDMAVIDPIGPNVSYANPDIS